MQAGRFSPLPHLGVGGCWFSCCAHWRSLRALCLPRTAYRRLFLAAALQIARAFNQLFDLKLTTRGEMEVCTCEEGRGVWGDGGEI